MNIPCPNKANQCVCYGNPLANLSSEDPDSEIFLSLQFFVAPGNEPCQVLCESTVSQADADLCAQRQGKECVNNPDPITEPDGETPSRPPATLYCNKPIPCTDPPGSIIVGCSTLGINQADADAIAGSLDCGVYAITPPPVAVCPIITGYGQVSPLQLAVGDSVVLSVSYTYAGTRTLSFNWYMDGLPFAVTTGPTLDLPGLTIPDSGTYLLVIAAPGCSAVSEAIVLTVSVCSQSGTAVPNDLWGAPVDLGNFVLLPVAATQSLGTLMSGTIRVTYNNGAYRSPNNPCPDAPPGTVWKITNYFSLVYSGGANSWTPAFMFCGASQVSIETQMAGATVDLFHDGGIPGATAQFNMSADSGYTCGSPCPSFNVVHIPYITVAGSGVSLKDWSTIRDTIGDCGGIGDLAKPMWDGNLLKTDGYVSNSGNLNLYTTFGVSDYSFDGLKRIAYVQVAGPYDYAYLVFNYEADFGLGIFAGLDPTQKYWLLEIWGYSGAAWVGCWLGVKQYGSDVLGRYEMKSACSGGPVCIEVEEIP